MKNILEIKNLNHSYAKELATITDFSFSLKKGEIVSILGESGSGKTTLLRIIAGLEQPTSGEVIINERVVSNKDSVLPPEKRNLGLVVEDRALFPHLNVEKNVMFGIYKAHAKESLALEYLSLFKVEHLGKNTLGRLNQRHRWADASVRR